MTRNEWIRSRMEAWSDLRDYKIDDFPRVLRIMHGAADAMEAHGVAPWQAPPSKAKDAEQSAPAAEVPDLARVVRLPIAPYAGCGVMVGDFFVSGPHSVRENAEMSCGALNRAIRTELAKLPKAGDGEAVTLLRRWIAWKDAPVEARTGSIVTDTRAYLAKIDGGAK